MAATRAAGRRPGWPAAGEPGRGCASSGCGASPLVDGSDAAVGSGANGPLSTVPSSPWLADATPDALPGSSAAATAPIAAVAAIPAMATPVVSVCSRDHASWRWPGVSGRLVCIRAVSGAEPFVPVTWPPRSTPDPGSAQRRAAPADDEPGAAGGELCRRASARPSPGRSRRRSRGPGPRRPRPIDVGRGGSGRRSAAARRPGMPGPESSTVTRDARRPRRHGDVDACRLRARTCRRCRAGRRAAGRASSGGAAITIGSSGDVHRERQAARLGDGREPVGRLAGEDPEVDRLAPGLAPAAASNRASQSMSSSSRRIRFVSWSTRPNAARYHAASAVLGEGQARVGLDDRERRAQLVRGVGGELELAAARRLDRRRDPPADRHRAEEHRARAGSARSAAPPTMTSLARRVTASMRLGDDDAVVADLGARRARTSCRRWSPSPGRETLMYSAGRAGVRRRRGRGRRRRRSTRAAARRTAGPVAGRVGWAVLAGGRPAGAG